MIHYLSATAINTANGVKHFAFCGEQLDYMNDKDKFRIYTPTEVTHFRCVVEYAKLYPKAYREWAVNTRNIRKEKAIGIEYDFVTGNFTQYGKVLTETEYVNLIKNL